ncbi:High affinity copper uptake protein 1 [Papilio machaon]|uniref:Copper transport protein n=2 Tax=Papilio machaon TaxID=76193 RepID=A0A194RDL8_PAPMA|nr:High affinity copper uptake protein 1 [Papilio machaon]
MLVICTREVNMGEHMHMDHSVHHGHHMTHNEAPGDHQHHQMNTTQDLTELILNNTPEAFHEHEEHSLGHELHGMESMTFHGGYTETILFSWWSVADIGEFIGSFLAIFIMALLYEGLKYYRKHLLWKTYTGLQYCAVAPPDKGVSNICTADEPQVIQSMPHVLERNIPTMMSSAHAWQTVLHGIQVFVSYMLMLVFMTYNTWLCAAVVLGSATGYFLFGWRESVVVDFTEHCH